MPDLAKGESPTSYSNPAAYERFMGRWSARLSPLFTQFAGLYAGQHILDVGCGTGSLSRHLLDSSASTRVVGVDPTEDYVSFARQEVASSRARFDVGLAESLPFPDETFDAALALLVLQDVSDTARTAREMLRVTRQGGSVAACVWDFRDGMPMFALFWQAAETVAPEAVARRRAERAATPLGLQELADLWTRAGLAAVRTAALELTQEFASFDDYWRPYLEGATPTCQFAATIDRDTRGALTATLRRMIPDVRSDGSFSLPARAFAVTGLARAR
jgi:ubiquinone/menaquinone biosynthesis C-methylase UbiE